MSYLRVFQLKIQFRYLFFHVFTHPGVQHLYGNVQESWEANLRKLPRHLCPARQEYLTGKVCAS
jgi:hypothetical protein